MRTQIVDIFTKLTVVVEAEGDTPDEEIARKAVMEAVELHGIKEEDVESLSIYNVDEEKLCEILSEILSDENKLREALSKLGIT